MSINPLTVLHIEPHSWWREIVATSLARWPEYRLLAAVGTGLEGVEQAMALQPTVVLFDWRLPDIDPHDLATALQAMAPAPRLALLTEPDPAIVPAFVARFGLCAVIQKNTRVPEHLPAALGEIRAGRTYLPAYLSSAAMNQRVG